MTSASSSSINNDKFLTILKESEVTMECKNPVDPTALIQAKAILSELGAGNDDSGNVPIDPSILLPVARRLGDVPIDAKIENLVISREDCRKAFEEDITEEERKCLINIHGRVKTFAEMQRQSVKDMEMDIPGGKAGHTVAPCKTAGCYAPGGRYPLPSSVIMTAVTARAAGCETVILASPKPATITKAAAHICDVDIFLAVGGAQAIASMAYGVQGIFDVPCDVIVGPGNKWVTAAKSIVSGYCGIDMLAGPSEVLVICDDTANPEIVAADLIAQAEHDVVARAILLSTDAGLIEQIEENVSQQVSCLPEPNQSTARAAFGQSFAVLCEDLNECIRLSDKIAPEHLEIHTREAHDITKKCANYGGAFVGAGAAEVMGDYGAGPNHTLPTGGTGRYTGGLSVFNFLRIRTWMRIDDQEKSQGMVHDSIILARCEGLEGHARAAEARSLTQQPAYKKPTSNGKI